ncbi:MAG TPA: CcmD family protein [Candidatus Binatia bacterium]|jgi:CcmD family protein
MDGWEYVTLAYGIVWTGIALYWLSLRKRLKRALAKFSEAAARKKTATHA